MELINNLGEQDNFQVAVLDWSLIVFIVKVQGHVLFYGCE